MFKRSRIRIIAAIMAALLLFLLIAIGVIYASSFNEIQNQNRDLLEQFSERYDIRDHLAPPEGDQQGFPQDNFIPGYTDDDELYDDDEHVDNFDGREFEPGGRGRNDGRFRNAFELSTFYAVAVSDSGEVLAVNSGNEDVISSSDLEEMALDILEEGSSEGSKDDLIYLVKEKDEYELVAFMDNSIVRNNMSTLLKYTLISFAISVAVIFLLSLFLSKKIIEPLEENDRRQKQFVSDAGHELKTPLAVMSANCELLEKEIGKNQWLDNIEYENNRMSTLVRDLLELSRAESGILQEENTDLSNLVIGEVLPFESIAFEKGLTLNTDIKDGIFTRCNPSQLKQLTAILLDNAISHSEGGSTVDLSLTSDNRTAVLNVSNCGKEIPRDRQAMIFERFYRVDEARTGEDSHYGLGLAIAKAITVSHGGKIGVECKDGKVTFSASIPIK